MLKLSACVFLAGVGVCFGNAGTITVNTSQMSFGPVHVSLQSIKTVTITNSGSVAVTINSITPTTTTPSGVPEFFIGNVPRSVAAHTTATFNVDFAPAQGGSASGTVVISSTAVAPYNQITIRVSGTGQHWTQLTWGPGVNSSCYQNFRYNVYVSSTSGNYTTPLFTTTTLIYVDDLNPIAGQTLYYVVTAVADYINDGVNCTAVTTYNMESPYSSEVSGTTPTP